MFKTLIPAVAALGLVAFAAKTRSADEAAIVPTVEAPAMGWHLSHEDTMAKLAYGVANSDQLAMMVTCAPGDTVAVVYGDVQPVGARVIQASMTTMPMDPLSGGDAEEFRIGLNDPSLLALAQTGRMTVVSEAGRSVIRATPAERQTVDQFLQHCGLAQA